MIDRIEGHSFLSHPIGATDVVIDLGANRGRFAREVAARYGCRIVGAEPVPGVMAKSPLPAGVSVESVALTDRVGQLELYASADTDATGMLSLAGTSARAISVAATTLEQFLWKHHATDAALIKVDIEGAEFAMFDATPDEVLCRIAQFSVEYHDFIDPALRLDVERIDRRFRNLGFWRIAFSRDNTDILYVNLGILPLRFEARFYIAARFRYARGVGRMLGRYALRRRA